MLRYVACISNLVGPPHGFARESDAGGERMRTIARGLVSLLDKPARAAIVSLGLFVGALLGASNDPTAPTHTVQPRKNGGSGDRDG